jgi:hypothetical protein
MIFSFNFTIDIKQPTDLFILIMGRRRGKLESHKVEAAAYLPYLTVPIPLPPKHHIKNLKRAQFAESTFK